MATVEVFRREMNFMIPWFMHHENIWSHYDREVDVLYLHFKKPSHADDSEITEDDLIIRYENGEVIGVTVMNASQRGLAFKVPESDGRIGEQVLSMPNFSTSKIEKKGRVKKK